jgi:hypothetical protein
MLTETTYSHKKRAQQLQQHLEEHLGTGTTGAATAVKLLRLASLAG